MSCERDPMLWERDKYFFHMSPQCCRKKQNYQTIFIMRICLMRNNTLRIIPDLSLLHTSDSPLMTMMEIGCSDEGDWGLDEGGFYDCPLGRLIE